MTTSPGLVVIDDFLEEDAWTEVWTMFQVAELVPVSRTAGAWKLGDGVPLGGEVIVTRPRDVELPEPGEEPGTFPSGSALDHVLIRGDVLSIS